jgi:hypothetical protein
MTESIMYHDGNRQLQDRFDSRQISDRLEEKLTRTQFTLDDKAFIKLAPGCRVVIDMNGVPQLNFAAKADRGQVAFSARRGTSALPLRQSSHPRH